MNSSCCNTFDDKKDREHSFFSNTVSICPTCKKKVVGKIVFQNNKVIIKKYCPEHGNFEGLLSSDKEYWIKSLSYTKPGTIPKKFSSKVEKGCPDDCGLCHDHEQHTCSPIIEINNVCDLKCPVCIVWNKNDYQMSYENFVNIVDGLIEKEGDLELVLLSGGEPTLHPEFFKFVAYLKSKKEINRILISSHGLKIAKDEAFAKKFKEMNLYLSLQFDTLKKGVYPLLRGHEFIDEKLKCIEMCKKYNIPTVLVPTIVKDINDSELGDIVNFAFSHDFVTSVTFQPMAYTGSGGTTFSKPVDKLTQPDIHQNLAKTLPWLNKDDFLPIPCSHPSCYSACYIIKTEDSSFVPLSRLGELDSYLNVIKNKALISSDENSEKLIQDSIYNLWSAQALTVDSEKVLASLKSLLSIYSSEKSLTDDEVRFFSERKIKAIFIHSFMDELDFDISRIQKCCTHYALPDGSLIPGCAYNNIHRHNKKFMR